MNLISAGERKARRGNSASPSSRDILSLMIAAKQDGFDV